MTRRPAGRLAIYSAGIEAVTWAGLVPFTIWQLARGTLAPGALGERLGRPRRPQGAGVRVVVHAVSLGELAAARGLLAVLGDAIPGARVTLTVGTAAARAVAARLVGQSQVDAVQYLPWDRPRAIRSWLSAVEPALVIVLETELWPGLLDACHTLNVPVAFVSARVYPQDVAGYRLIHGFLAPLLERAALVAAQSPDERNRLLAMGAPRDRTIVNGDLKAIAALAPAPLPARITSIASGSFPMIVAGCSHDPEEHWLLEAFTATRRVHPDARLALAPRAIDRARQVARSAAAAGFDVATTTGARGGHWDVLVVDESGVLAGLYRHSTIAVIGGTLAPHGGHSLLEAAAAGVPILCGPHTAHVEAQVARFSDAGALVRADRDSLGGKMISLLEDPGRVRAVGAAAREVVSDLASEAADVSIHIARLLGAPAEGQKAVRATV